MRVGVSAALVDGKLLPGDGEVGRLDRSLVVSGIALLDARSAES